MSLGPKEDGIMSNTNLEGRSKVEEDKAQGTICIQVSKDPKLSTHPKKTKSSFLGMH